MSVSVIQVSEKGFLQDGDSTNQLLLPCQYGPALCLKSFFCNL